ncbi:hypothetical protein [Frigoriglobus tundricola]|uniref:Uncharacterized protein n=1 Tax=Frigoriglobus tundricola TaxID=2774151 RepID=A0A6M5YTZ5_9BACT|nr:hypothetical protein [Frigoriglobus tundricola]QJW96793.1 hypothetical protein FTUN_4352 [Frigoriglobus tundricola]
MVQLKKPRRGGTAVLCVVLLVGPALGPSQPAVALSAPGGQPTAGSGPQPPGRVSVRKTSAPVPKQQPRDGVIAIVPGYPRTPARLLTPDGTVIGELPFDDVHSCALSPSGARMAVVVREQPVANPGPGTSTFAVHVADIDADRKKIGEPLAFGLSHPVLAWAGDGKLYVSELQYPQNGSGFLRPAGVTVHDVTKRTATPDKGLRGCCVLKVSPDGTRLLARRIVTEPVERSETVLLDAVTREPVDAGAEGVTLTHFFGPNKMLGTRAAPKGAADATEHVVFDLTTKKSAPVSLPKEVLGDSGELMFVLPSPDGKRLLHVWSEQVPAPANWPPGGPCRVARMTTSDPSGGRARTIFNPAIKERQDEIRNHVGGSVDWR